MGCKQSDLSNGEYEDMGARVNSLLASLPKLYCEIYSENARWLCTAYVTEDFEKVLFACTNNNALYQKIVTQDELIKMRDTLDINHTVGWWQFFNALKHAFFNKKIHLSIRSEAASNDSCDMAIALNFATLGRASISLKLKVVPANMWERVFDVFFNPLFQYYHARSTENANEKIDQLDKDIKFIREKISLLEELQSKDNNATPKAPQGSSTTDKKPENTAIEVEEHAKELVIPSEKIVLFLKDVQERFGKKMSEPEMASFSNVIQLLSKDVYQSGVYEEKKVDVEIIAQLRQPQGKDVKDMAFVQPSEFLKNSNINRAKTREDITAMFEKVDDWNFDVFTIQELTEGQTLFVTGYTLFVKYNYLQKFNIPEQTLINFMKEIEQGYHPNPYHNSMHAADVMQGIHYIVSKGGIGQLLSEEERMSTLLAAYIHDYDHPGLNNAFQIATSSYLANLYNDRSVLENHHCAQAFELMRSKNYNILVGLSPEQRREVRETVVQLVLSTDMGHHGAIVGKFKSMIDVEHGVTSKQDIRLALQIAMKMSDVSNPARPIKLYMKWAQRICDEFFNQGDKERELGLPISPLMDRTNATIGKSQIGFIDYIVKPMYDLFTTAFPKMKFIMDIIKENRVFWETHTEF